MAGSGRGEGLFRAFDRAGKAVIFHAFSGQRICRSGFIATLLGRAGAPQKKESGENAAPSTHENLKFHSRLRGSRPRRAPWLWGQTPAAPGIGMLPPVEGALYGPFIAGRTAMATGDFRQFMGVKLATLGVGVCGSLSCGLR